MDKGFWRKLYEQMLSDLESGAWRRMSSYTVGGRTVSYRSFDEFKKLIDWARTEADLEDGIRPYRRRTYAGQGGRG